MSKRTKTLKKYRDMEAATLVKEEADLRNAVWKLKLQKGTGQIADPHKLASAKRDLARVLTLQREREAAPAAGKRS
jgi:large subunit ribosomal protein L29